MTRIYIVRHAEAMGNVLEFFQGRTDTEVSEKGKKQLECLGERFKDIHIDVLYSSPLSRAMATAGAVNRYHGLPVQVSEEIIEINGGDWENRKWSELPQLFPKEYDLWRNEINRFAAPNGESTLQVYDRMKEAMRKIAHENRGKTVAVVSHGMAIKAYLNYAEGREWENYEDPGWSDNTAVSLVEYSDDLVPRIIIKNDISHLDGDLSTLAMSNWCKE